MEVVQIDVIEAEPLKRSIARLMHVTRAAVDHAPGCIASFVRADARGETKLRCHGDPVTAALERLAHQAFGFAIDVGRIEQSDAEIERAMNQGDSLRVALYAAGIGLGNSDAHAAESQSGNLRALKAQFAVFHAELLAVQVIVSKAISRQAPN